MLQRKREEREKDSVSPPEGKKVQLKKKKEKKEGKDEVGRNHSNRKAGRSSNKSNWNVVEACAYE